MSASKVPENHSALSREKQLQLLVGKLAGHKAFNNLRGKIFGPVDLKFAEFILNAKSPSEFCRRWDQLSGELRVIGNLISQFYRDNNNHAVKEILKALSTPDYIIEGEEIPTYKTQPVTVLMFNFARTLSMIKWIRCGHWMQLNRKLKGKTTKKDKLVNNLFENFPSLEKYSRQRLQEGSYEGWDLIAAYEDDVLNPFNDKINKLPDNAYMLEIKGGTYNDHLEIGRFFNNPRFGIVIPGEQKKVLKLFGRSQQKQISTWQCILPEQIIYEKNYVIGFHPEKLHTSWQNKVGAFSSHGCSNQYGIAFLDNINLNTGKYLERYNQNGLQLVNGAKNKFMFVLEAVHKS